METHTGNSVRLAVANLSFDTTEGQINALFDLFGDVLEVQLIRSRASGRFRGRASVWMADQSVRGEVILPRVLNLNGSQLRVLLLKPDEMEDVDLGPAPRRFKRLLYWMKPALKSCARCQAEIQAFMEVCPQCREKQPVAKRWIWWAFLGAAVLAWIAFH